MYKIDTERPLVGWTDSRIGGRPDNQDNYGYSDTPIGLAITVCDGMGGMNGGSTASETAVKTIIDKLCEASKDDNPADVIHDAVVAANKAIIDKEQEDSSLAGMGTTATVLLLNDEAAWVCHVGDSRVYQLRHGRKVFRTFDDSMVFQYVKNKAMTEEQARQAPNSNVILKALGIKEELEFDVVKLPYRRNDRFILCTDGFWGNMPERDFLNLVTARGNLKDVATVAFAKIELAGLKDERGHFDNLTAAFIDVKSSSLFQPALLERLMSLLRF